MSGSRVDGRMRLNCGHEVEPTETVYLREDDTVDCDDCHADALREDIFDRLDHGTPYTASVLYRRFKPDLTNCKETNS